MKRNFKFTIFIFLKCLLHFSLSIKPGDVKLSRRLTGHTFKTLSGMPLSTCAAFCQRKVNCKSINYNRKQKICELNTGSESHSNFLHLAAGWLFSESGSWNNILPCNHNLCQQNETCIKTGDLLECKIEECDVTINVDSAIVLGNMNNVGSVFASEYDSGYGLSYFVCEDDGNWKYLKEANESLICQNKPSVNAELEFEEAYIKTYDGLKYLTALNKSYISSLVIKHGSTITFRCTNASYLIGDSTINCTFAQWSVSPNVSCIDMCPVFKRYSYSMRECVNFTSCKDGYADTFQSYANTVLWLHDYDHINALEEQDCIDACLSNEECDSFDFSKLWKVCYLQKLEFLDTYYIRRLLEWSYYQRDCN